MEAVIVVSQEILMELDSQYPMLREKKEEAQEEVALGNLINKFYLIDFYSIII